MKSEGQKVRWTLRLQEILLRFSCHPFVSDTIFDLRKDLVKSKNIAIALPPGGVPRTQEKHVFEILQLFEKQNPILLTTNSGQKTGLSGRIIEIPDQASLRSLLKSDVWNRIEPVPDLFLDLDPGFSLFNLIFCKKIRPGIRIAFQKPYAERYYNLILKNSAGKYNDRLIHLSRLLGSMFEDVRIQQPRRSGR